LPAFESRFIGAITTVFVAETVELVTFFVVFETDFDAEEIGLKSEVSLDTAGRTLNKMLDKVIATVKIRPIL
jgi:hypothetical protein